MKNFTICLILLLSVTIIGCAKTYVRPVADCSDPVCHKVYITDDKSIVEAINEIINCELMLDSQIQCFKKATK
jgi:hypothetical protein